MKIESILVENFRGIRRIQAQNLGTTIIIAGQNGSGKSCVFDAIRLLKTAYGGYQENEWQNWFGEFAIPANANADNLRSMFNDPSRELRVDIDFSISDDEKSYLSINAEKILTDVTWRTILPEAFQFGSYRLVLFSRQFREREPEVRERVQRDLPALREELTQDRVQGLVFVPPGESLQLRISPVLSAIFSTYEPKKIGVLDYHGAQRHYGRELVKTVNISLDEDNSASRQHALYNYSNKYNNVKSELAASYVKEKFIQDAGGGGGFESLTDTLKELFETFFPDKKFLGPTPTRDGNLTFPVRTPSGVHDLDDLSAGEKEILYGYLRIRNSAPQNSIILLDEPELHLNPRLIRNLPDFYRRHLGDALGNQIWLVSHSDALLREAFGKPNFDMFHMQPCSVTAEDGTIPAPSTINQLRPLTAMKDVDVVLTDLVGDLAAYEPGRRAIIFEGGGDTDFDQRMVARLFPEIAKGFNLISGTSKTKVRALHQVLDRAYEKGELKTKFYAIVDKDFDNSPRSEHVNLFSWNVYHIENYLLDFDVVQAITSDVKGKRYSINDVKRRLEKAARETVKMEMQHRLIAHLNREIIGAINIGGDPNKSDFGKEVINSLDRSIDRVNALKIGVLSDANIRDVERKILNEIEESFGDGSWISRLPGRDILNRYVAALSGDVSYKGFRNLLLSRMADEDIQPAGMKEVLDKIIGS